MEVTTVRTVSTYDLVLSVIPGPFVLAALAWLLWPVSLSAALAAAAVPSALAVGYALFYHPPVGRRDA